MAASVEEHVIFFAGFDIHYVAVGKPEFEFTYCSLRYWHESFFGTFADNADEFFVKVEVRHFEMS